MTIFVSLLLFQYLKDHFRLGIAERWWQQSCVICPQVDVICTCGALYVAKPRWLFYVVAQRARLFCYIAYALNLILDRFAGGVVGYLFIFRIFLYRTNIVTCLDRGYYTLANSSFQLQSRCLRHISTLFGSSSNIGQAHFAIRSR